MTQLSDAEIAELEAARRAYNKLNPFMTTADHDAALSAAIAAAKAQRDDGWRTMESAPKDGRLFVAAKFWPAARSSIGRDHWVPHEARYDSEKQCFMYDYGIRLEDSIYQDGERNFDSWRWTELPAPPSLQETE